MSGSTHAAQTYISMPRDSAEAEMAYDAILQNLAAEYEADGYTGKDIDGMDLDAVAQELIARARG